MDRFAGSCSREPDAGLVTDLPDKKKRADVRGNARSFRRRGEVTSLGVTPSGLRVCLEASWRTDCDLVSRHSVASIARMPGVYAARRCSPGIATGATTLRLMFDPGPPRGG